MEDLDPQTLITTTRHKCAACFQQFKKKEHLVAHMKKSRHSVHQPKCGVCQKHCKSFESLREHISGPLAKAQCSSIFSQYGCQLCMKVFESPISLGEHKDQCILTAPDCLGTMHIPYIEYEALQDVNYIDKDLKAVAVDCQMVGCGSDGSLDQLARVCLVDEEENIIFHTYVEPQISVTDNRYELTGLTEEHLIDAMPLRKVQEKISQILYNGESIGKARLDGGKAKLLVGHNLEHDLDCLLMSYPDKLLRDTATYRPLMKTNLVSHSLKYLTKTYLGYDIRLGTHDTFQDCVSVMRLYKRMRAQEHQDYKTATSCTKQSLIFDNGTSKDLENMSPDELFQISTPNYQCWCLDSRPRDPP
ncbi:putative exoribonuclease II transcription factor C2H2 family [Helianthus annuus]|nr:putative exoribonuclease II transcription factor C2H2 family [Helianthus annuus]